MCAATAGTDRISTYFCDAICSAVCGGRRACCVGRSLYVATTNTCCVVSKAGKKNEHSFARHLVTRFLVDENIAPPLCLSTDPHTLNNSTRDTFITPTALHVYMQPLRTTGVRGENEY